MGNQLQNVTDVSRFSIIHCQFLILAILKDLDKANRESLVSEFHLWETGSAEGNAQA